jgi:hypothetical protein
VSTFPLPSGEPELGYEPTQLHRLANVVEAHLHRVQEEIEQATQALKQVKGIIVEQHGFAEHEKVSLQKKFEEEKA